MKGQSEFARAKRLHEGSCPTHGIGLTQIDGWPKKDPREPTYAVVACPRDDCDVVAKQQGASGPATLLPHGWLQDRTPLTPEQFWAIVPPKEDGVAFVPHILRRNSRLLNLGSSEVLLLVLLLNDRQLARQWPLPTSTLAKELGTTEQKIQRSITRLESTGFLPPTFAAVPKKLQ
jgi:hypothetical protein